MPGVRLCENRSADWSVMNRGKRKENVGVVVSSTMDKTIIVRVGRRIRHPLYGKEMTLFNKCYVHDVNNEAKPGDKVRIVETRPLSRTKRWRLVEILAKSRGQASKG